MAAPKPLGPLVKPPADLGGWHIPEPGADLDAPPGLEPLTLCGLTIFDTWWEIPAREAGDRVCRECALQAAMNRHPSGRRRSAARQEGNPPDARR
jgi:hypothetical protein